MLKRSFQRVKVLLCSGDPMEEMNEFICDGVFMEKGNVFKGV